LIILKQIQKVVPYRDQSYNQLVAQSYGHIADIYDKSADYKIVKSLYERNYLNGGEGIVIPKKIHQVWIGGRLPEIYHKFTESWRRFHPDWEYKLWGDSDVDGFGMQNEGFFRSANTNGQKSDIFRYEILRRYGGLYVDTDFECLKPFDDLLYLNFLTSSGYTANLELYIGLIACTPSHPIIERCVNDMKNVHHHNSVMDVFHTTGSYYFTKCFLKEVNAETDGVVAMPPLFFYPWPNNIRGDPQPYRHVKPFSYAIHHWAVSWIKK
jgi:mannosyltransferase OCH1-like enzyme